LRSWDIFAKARRVADRRSSLLEVERGAVVDGGADGEAAPDEDPRTAKAEAMQVKFQGAAIGEIDREGTDERARCEGEDASQRALGERDIKAHGRADEDGGCCPEPDE
jgi:hypothetical protein